MARIRPDQPLVPSVLDRLLDDEPDNRNETERPRHAVLREIKQAVRRAQDMARSGAIAPEEVADAAVESLPVSLTSIRPVINATGVVLHTNLGRAPLGPAAIEALGRAAGYVDIEFELTTGHRARRGGGALAALAEAVPAAQSVMVVNNGAAALVLATTALAAGREVVVSRGELIEIGAGFRLPDLVESTGCRSVVHLDHRFCSMTLS